MCHPIDGFIIKRYCGVHILPRANRKCLLLIHCQKMDVQRFSSRQKTNISSPPLQGILYVDGCCANLALNLVVNYHLVVSYLQQWHIWINVSHWCVIVTAIHITLLFASSRAELWIIFYKLLIIVVICNEKQYCMDLISNIMSKRQGILTETLPFFFSNAGKTGNVPELKLDIF